MRVIAICSVCCAVIVHSAGGVGPIAAVPVHGRGLDRVVLPQLTPAGGSGRPGRPVSPQHDGSRGRSGERKRNTRMELDRASRLVRDRRFGEAIVILERLLEKYPEIAAAAELLSTSYLRAGRPNDARRLLENMLLRNPDSFTFIRNLGHAYLDLGQKDKAIEVWNRILRDDVNYAGYYGLIARLEKEAGLYEEALDVLRRGRRFEKHFGRYTMEIVKLERILGRERAAFREGLFFLARTKDPGIGQAGVIFDIFRDNGAPVEYLAEIDSVMLHAGKQHRSLFRMLASLLMVEASAYDEASAYRDGKGGEPPGERELYEFVNRLSGMKHRSGDEAFERFFLQSLDGYWERYGTSNSAPGVLLMMALQARRLAWGAAGPPDHSLLERAVQFADSVKRHPWGVPFRAKASYVKAVILMDDMHRPERALETLRGVRFQGTDMIRRVEELRLRALIASCGWEEAAKHLDALAAADDTVLAALARYGSGQVNFYFGNYEKAVKELSEFAERHAWSAWANNALETAMMTRKALLEGAEPLDLYRAALLEEAAGNTHAAVDSLDGLRMRFPRSVLVPRARFKRAELSAGLGLGESAGREFIDIAEAYPLHDLAPRALERAAELAELDRPAEAARRYGEILERYPRDPFLERVRNRYIALRKRIDGSSDDGGKH